ncbi:CBS domain-containing protein [Candidatus Woesearchaeota archaeon]|nr:CBS domain-containing protein [Candidatus Woesearchaeota archaeon]
MDKIKDWMVKNVVTISKQRTVKEACEMMDAHDVGTLVVVEVKKPIGILTERDIIRQIIAVDKDPRHMKVHEVMTKQVFTVGADDDVAKVSREMTLHHVKRLPVVNKAGHLIGIVTSTDMIKIMAEKWTLG